MLASKVRLGQWVGVGLFVLFAFGLQGFFAFAMVRQVLHPERMVRPFIKPSDSGPVVEGVSADAYPELKGIQKGDQIVAVNGHPYVGIRTLGEAEDGLDPGDSLTIQVNRGGKPQPPVTFKLRAAPPPSWRANLLNIALGAVLPIFNVLLGATVLIMKPWDRVAWFLAAMVTSFSYTLANATFFGLPYLLEILLSTYFTLAQTSWPMWFLLFALYFPDRHPVDRRAPWAKWILIAPLIVLVVIDTVTRLAANESSAIAASIAWLDRLAQPWRTPVATAAVFAFFALIGYRLMTEKAPDARRRLQLLMAGANITFTPLLVIFVVLALVTKYFMKGATFSSDQPWIAVLLLLTLPVFPLTLGYLVVVHKALDIRVVVRQGLQYALATRGVLVLRVLVTMAVLWFAVFASQNASPTWRIVAYAVAAAFVFGIRRSAQTLRKWIDKRFFREAYHAEYVLTELADSVRRIVETKPLVETVARRISDTLHVPRVAVLLADGPGGYSPVYALGYDRPPSFSLARTAVTVKELSQAAGPVRVYFDDPNSWLNRPTGPSDEERKRLEELQSQLLLPLSNNDRMLGFMSLGPKLSEEPYSGSDLRLLSSVAGQAGLALENSRLAATIAQETASRERLNRELEIAREVQQRFFPQRQPAIEGLDYAGFCLPAQSVGGDFYDFRPLEDGRLAVAVGDVAGKGAPAALLMASLQASLRAQAAGGGTTGLDTMINRLNSLICEITPASRFSTLFYAQYDPGSRELRYVNAGHNPPFLIRREGAVRLVPCGLAIGLSRTAAYVERSVMLCPGDLLAAFTDGVTEAMNEEREDFGEERLEAVLDGCRLRGETAEEVVQAVRRSVEEHVRSAPQHDDLTLVVMRLL
jgi:sigma-B regulation protein RsbU (phosphoserine phosphatase)